MAFTEMTRDGLPLERSSGETRVAFLKKVYALSFLGLIASAVSAMAMVRIIPSVPALQGRWAMLIVILGCWGVANFVCPGLAAKRSTEKLGFFLGSVFMGLAMGYLLLAAMIVSAAQFENPFALINIAVLLTAATAGGLTLYVWTSPSDFKWAGAIMSALFLPMLVLMGITWVFPVNGAMGIAISSVFIVISVIGLLYQTRVVMKEMDSTMVYPGALMITLGILVLFWNILALLMRLTSRD